MPTDLTIPESSFSATVSVEEQKPTEKFVVRDWMLSVTNVLNHHQTCLSKAAASRILLWLNAILTWAYIIFVK